MFFCVRLTHAATALEKSSSRTTLRMRWVALSQVTTEMTEMTSSSVVPSKEKVLVQTVELMLYLYVCFADLLLWFV